MTVQQLMNRLDEQVPNTISREQKDIWLVDLELGLEMSFPTTGDLSIAPEKELLIPQPWDNLYFYYLEAKIYYAQGDIARFNQANAMTEALFSGYRDYYHRTHLRPPQHIKYV